MFRNKILFFLFLLLPGFYFSQEISEDWQVKKDEAGIIVYNRKSINSSYKELKSVLYVKTSLQSLVALVGDWESYPLWVYRCDESTTLKKLSDTSVIHYQSIDVPWPAENRDFVVKNVISQDKKTKIVTMKSFLLPNYIPEKSKMVRITEMSACWTFVPIKDGKVQVNYQLFVNVGGNIPAWLVNIASADGPLETMINLKEFILKKKYQEAKIPFIKEAN